MMSTLLADYLAEAKARQLDELVDWLKIPSISTKPEHSKDIREAAQWLVDHLDFLHVCQYY